MLRCFIRDEAGQTLVEYGLLISLIALVVITALTAVGGKLRAGFSAAASGIRTTT